MPLKNQFQFVCVFPLGELDKPLKYFVSVELDQIYETNIDVCLFSHADKSI